MFLELGDRCTRSRAHTAVHSCTARISRPREEISPQLASWPLLSSENMQEDKEIGCTGRKMTNHQNSQSLLFWLIAAEKQQGIRRPCSSSGSTCVLTALASASPVSRGHSAVSCRGAAAFCLHSDSCHLSFADNSVAVVPQFLTATQMPAHSQHWMNVYNLELK